MNCTYIISFSMAPLEVAYYYYAYFSDKKTDTEKVSNGVKTQIQVV